MPLFGRYRAPFPLMALLVLVAPMLLACGEGDQQNTISWTTVDEPVTSTPHPEPPAGVGGLTAPLPPDPSVQPLSSEELVRYQPNELGFVPILEYHVITTNPEEEAQFVRTADDMRADLQWLYEHDFHVVSLTDVVNNTIAVPAGKHPVALTFDDGTSSQFSFIRNAQGDLVPDPDSAIGILEDFYEEHPDFGRGGHFGILVFNAFAYPDDAQEPFFQQKLEWMIERGYEIGNHTWQHTDLTDIPTEEFVMTVAEPMLWADATLGDVPGNASRILTLPYGTSPDRDLHPDQRQLMRDGFTYQGQEFRIDAALLVGSAPVSSPASTGWDPLWIPRIQMFDESVDFWFGQMASGETVLYTSDGFPDTVAVPLQLPAVLGEQLDEAALTLHGKQVIRYNPATGELAGVRDVHINAIAESPHPGVRRRPGVIG